MSPYYKAFRQKEKDQSFVSKLWSLFGWDGWTRTNEWRSQSPLPYRLATPQYYNRIIINKNTVVVKQKMQIINTKIRLSSLFLPKRHLPHLPHRRHYRASVRNHSPVLLPQEILPPCCPLLQRYLQG